MSATIYHLDIFPPGSITVFYFFGAIAKGLGEGMGILSQILTDAGFIYPPVRSEKTICRAIFEILEIHVFLKKLPGILAARLSESRTIRNARNPSVSAP